MIKGAVNYIVSHPNFYIFGLLFVTVFVLYFIIGKAIKNSRMHHDQKRRFMVNTRTIFLFVIASAVFILWANELYQFVISLAALLAAFAIAGKELFLCYGGSFYKAFARPFSVGDRIQVGDIRGDVVDIGLLSTQILEVGPKDYTQQLTGRTITLPNSLFLTSSVFNETDDVYDDHKDFVLHVIKVPISNDGDWEKKKDLLLESANDVCGEYIEAATTFFQLLAKKRQVAVPHIEPRINIRFESPTLILFIVRITVPVDKKGHLEQKILKNYLEKLYK